jgi:glutathione synthase/RimK-type ligase-like ATP-grasp enzyme
MKSYCVAINNCRDSAISLPAELLKKLDLNKNARACIYFGSAEVSAQICRWPRVSATGDCIGLSKKAASALQIPVNTSVKVRPEGDTGVRIGPVIGILTFNHVIQNGNIGFYTPRALLNRNNGLLYVFSGKAVSTQKGTIGGYRYDYAKSAWVYGEFPFPDVVIDRTYPNNYRCHKLLGKSVGTKFFNKKSCINKWDFYRTVSTAPDLREFLPETARFKGNLDIDKMLGKYEKLFFKPVNAMKGIGIVAVSAVDKGQLECRYRSKGEILTKLIPSSEMIPTLLKEAAGRKRAYIIQQGIDIFRYQGEVLSFRVWAMKNGKGQWVMPGMYATVSGSGGFLTNTRAGGRFVPLNTLFADIIPRLPYTKEYLVGQLECLALRTAVALDKRYGPLGELGLDIALDIDGRLWLIEANGNPGKRPIFWQTEYPEWRTSIYKYPLDYASYLAGFNTALVNIIDYHKISKPNSIKNQLKGGVFLSWLNQQ